MEQPEEKCEKHISRILPNLFLSDRIAANDPRVLKTYGITHILNVSDKSDLVPKWISGYQQINIYDLPWVNIEQYFHSSAQFISGALEESPNNKVLVHCHMGKSRSATLVIAYLVQEQNMKLQDAVQWVKQCRPCIEPNDGFLRQLHRQFDPDFVDVNSGNVVISILLIFCCMFLLFLAFRQ